MPFLAPAMPFLIPALGSVGASAVGGALAGRAGNRTQTSESSRTGSITPIEPEQFKGLEDLLIGRATGRLNSPIPIEGLRAGGISGINDVFNTSRQSLENRLTNRGLSTSPVAGAGEATLEASRASEISRFENQLPLIERSLQDEDFRNALALFGQRPIGQRTEGTSTGEVVFPGSPTGGAFSGAGSMLGFLIGQGILGNKSKPPGSSTSFFPS